MEEDLKILKVELLSIQWSDISQIWNSSFAKLCSALLSPVPVHFLKEQNIMCIIYKFWYQTCEKNVRISGNFLKIYASPALWDVFSYLTGSVTKFWYEGAAFKPVTIYDI